MSKIGTTIENIGSSINKAAQNVGGYLASTLPDNIGRSLADSGGILKDIVASTVRNNENVGDVVTLALSKAWILAGSVKPATTTEVGDRFDTSKLFCLQIGDYFMPMSQSFSLHAKKRLNVSSLVDGPDIIQQTRKQSKMIDVSLRLTLRNNQPNLEIVSKHDVQSDRFEQEVRTLFNGYRTNTTVDTDAAYKAMHQLSMFLQTAYERDQVLAVVNTTINNVFGVTHAVLSDYKFTPQTGRGTFLFEFSLMEVKYDDNVLTFDARQIDSAR